MEHAQACPRWGDDRSDANCNCRPKTLHRENMPPLDLAPIVARIKERRAYTGTRFPSQVSEIVNADTEMLEVLVAEIKRVRLANDSLRAALGPGRAMPVAK